MDIFFTAIARTLLDQARPTAAAGQDQAADKKTMGADLHALVLWSDVILPGTRKSADGLDSHLSRASIDDLFWGRDGLDLALWLTAKGQTNG